MEFTDIAMELSREAWQASFQHPFILQLQKGNLDPSIFRYYLIQDAYYLNAFSKAYEHLAEKTSKQEMRRLLKQNAQSLVEGELFIRQQFFKELGINDKEMAEQPIAPTCYHYISHIHRQFEEKNVAIAFASLLPCPWLYHDIGKALNLNPSSEALYQKWIETYITDELEQQIKEETELVNQLYRESDELDKKKMLEAFRISVHMEAQFWEMAYQHQTWKSTLQALEKGEEGKMKTNQLQIHKLTVLSMMIALDVVLTPIFRVEGMAPMSSVVNILAGTIMGPVYALVMATVTAFIRMTTQGIPPLALTGATFGALLAGLFYKYGRKFYFSALGEIIGTGIIGSIVSYPVMVLFTGSAEKLSWFIYTPRFIGATLIGTAIAFVSFRFLITQKFFKKVQSYFFEERIN